ncbi:MAG TPA: hypothetical protein VF006_17125 [Longimicrobium sp.]
MRGFNHGAYLLVTLAALSGCNEATAPDGIAGLGTAQAAVAAVSSQPVEQRKAMLTRAIEVRRRALANPDARYAGRWSDGREVSPVRVLRDMEAELARLNARGPASRDRSPRSAGEWTTTSDGLPVEGYSSGGVGNYGMCSIGDVGAYTLAYGAQWITSSTYVDFYINNEFGGGWSEAGSWTNYAYYENSLFSWGYREKCQPESVAGGNSHTIHEAGTGAQYGYTISVAIF